MRSVNALAPLLLALCGTAYAGQFTCASCHAKEAASQPGTPMANALSLPGHNALFHAIRDLRFDYGRFHYQIETIGEVTTYKVSDGANTIALNVKWSFGQSAQTFVLERDGQFFESLVSYYPAINGLDLTLGDASLNPKTVEEALGRKLELREITACFGCHSTNSETNGKLSLASLTAGITCQRCHASAPAHMAAMSHPAGKAPGKPPMPDLLGAKSSEWMSNFCGQCHRSWEAVVRSNWRGEMNSRFQPYRLANSQCFDGSDPRISCVACHNPHENVAVNPTSYDAKCLACHQSGVKAATTASAKTCPVANSGCTTCHMPKIQLPGGHQTFTDHDIRVVKAGEPYPN